MSFVFLKNYSDEMLETLKLRFPDKSEKFLKKIIKDQINEKFKDLDVTFVNEYEGNYEETTLSDITDWFMESEDNPIGGGFGVFFKQHSDPDAINLPAVMLQYLLKSRKEAKKKMFEALVMKNKAFDEGNMEDVEKYTDLMNNYDMQQKVYKLLANSYYGASGERNSIFYNRDMGASVTYTGVQVITTAVMAFEALVANNVPFKKLDDMYLFIKRVLEKEYEFEPESVFINTKMTHKKLVDYLVSHMEDPSEKDINEINIYTKNLTKDQMNYIYYTNNLLEFFKLEPIMEILESIVGNKFLNVENPPDEIKDNIEILYDLCNNFVVYDHLYSDRYDRAVNDVRKAVLMGDTDSNFINLGYFYNFFDENFELDKSDEGTLSIINIGIYLLAKYIQSKFNSLTGNLNVDEEHQPIINMKNEFLYSRLMLTSNKKQYAGNLISQEGHILSPSKFDIKGLSIKKITVNPTIRNYFTEIIENDILKSKEIKLNEIITKFKKLEDEIKTNILEGNISFTVPGNVNNIDSYKFPYRMPTVRGTIIWNALYPNQSIVPPEKINTLKLTIKELNDLRPIFGTPEYDIIKKTIFDDKDFKEYGMTTIAIPKSVEKIPEWLIQFIAIDEIVADNIRNGIIILESIGMKTLNVLDKSYYSNIIEF